jgi:hypothetical protein
MRLAVAALSPVSITTSILRSRSFATAALEVGLIVSAMAMRPITRAA